MANTYHQMIVQLVWSTARRNPVIKPEYREAIHRYISGIVSHQKCKMLEIFAMPDHVHILIGLHPATAVSDLVREIKEHSTLFIRKEFPDLRNFSWQRGFGVFSYAKNQLKNVASYIANQEIIHRQRDFKDEYVAQLKSFEIEYEERYVFDE